MKKNIFAVILILICIMIVGGCGGSDTLDISGTTINFKIETLSDGRIVELLTINFAHRDYASQAALDNDKNVIERYFVVDEDYYLEAFKRHAAASPYLSEETMDEYRMNGMRVDGGRLPLIRFENKNVNNSDTLQVEIRYLDEYFRQVWYYYIATFNYEAGTGMYLDYRDEELFIGDDLNDGSDILQSKGTWFNKSYILNDSVYSYVFTPFPTFKQNFVNTRKNVTYTQTLIGVYDNLKSNADQEKIYQGGIVERTWVIMDVNGRNQIEYYVLQANRVSWYVLALAVSVLMVSAMFIGYCIKKTNKQRIKNINSQFK